MSSAMVLVEAERFGDTGGWVIDQQFMDEMGSPFLLAHGLGSPVADAVTGVAFPKPGTYRVWVRTRDWVGPWKTPETPPERRAEGAPGAFRVLVNGRALGPTFGAEGAEWHWQDGGVVDIEGESATVALHDLTGFEGRCDAILFCRDAAFAPPEEVGELARLRRRLLGHPEEPPSAGEFDVVVAGGGIAGTCAALAAARSGLSVAFIQDRPVLGGNNSSEVRVWLGGGKHGDRYPRIGDVVDELEQERRAHYGPENTADLYEDEKKEALVQSEPNITLFLGHRAVDAATDGDRLTSIVAQDIVTGARRRFSGRWFVDCTGDGCIGALAGADFELTRKGHMGRCNLWNVKDTGKPVSFPRCPWALDLSDKPFPGRGGDGGIEKLGGWYWESGFDHDPIRDREYIRDWNFRAMYGAWDALKNTQGLYPNHRLNWAAHISGPRESRRLLGDVILSKDNLMSGRDFEDGCVVTGWKIDVHLPAKQYEKGFEGDAFLSYADFTEYPTPFYIPYRCLYSRNVPNLFMAGRDISVTHEALGTARVMRTCGLMGEVVGMAAAVCKERGCDPRTVHTENFSELQERMQAGVGRCQLPSTRTSSTSSR